MPINAQMADGTILEFPDGTDAAVIDRAAREYVRSAPRGSAGAAPEPVATIPVPASEVPQSPLNAPVTKEGAAARSLGDTLGFQFMDELAAAVEAGAVGGADYEAAWQNQQALRAADAQNFPEYQEQGQQLGFLGSMLLPGGALGKVAGLGKQALTGAAIGAGSTALSGAGAQQMDERTANLGSDLLFGGTVGAAAPFAAAGARKFVQALPGAGGQLAQTAADDVILGSTLNRDELLKRAAEFQKAKGRGASVAELLTPTEAAQFTRAVGVSPAARTQAATAFRDTATALPQDLATNVANRGGLASKGDLVKRTVDRGDRDFGAFRDKRANIAEADRMVILNDIIKDIPLESAFKAKLLERLDTNSVTGGDLDILRRKIAKLESSVEADKSLRGTAMRETLLPIFADAIPESAGAVARYSKGMRAAEGAATGNAALNQGLVEGAGNLRRLDKVGAKGAEIGARTGVVEQAFRSPGQSYRFASRLENDPTLEAALRTTQGDQAAQEIIDYAKQSKSAIDALAALAKVPPEKLESLLDNADEMIDFVAAAGLGAGGAFKATLAKNMIARMGGIGENAANKLADDLLNPARREAVFNLLEKQGVSKVGVREIVEAAMIAAGQQAISTNRAFATSVEQQ